MKRYNSQTDLNFSLKYLEDATDLYGTEMYMISHYKGQTYFIPPHMHGKRQ
jgi:hypothetical protein